MTKQSDPDRLCKSCKKRHPVTVMEKKYVGWVCLTGYGCAAGNCEAVKRDGNDCTRPGSAWRNQHDRPLWLCGHHAAGFDLDASEHSPIYAAHRVIYGTG